jgi:cytochrome P450
MHTTSDNVASQISQGDFLAYPIHDVHLDEGLYPEPEKWNPNRWQENGKESTTWPFLGWGVGKSF